MDQLLDYPLTDSALITDLRNGDSVLLGLALAEAGCSVEAVQLLRPTRKKWKDDPKAAIGRMALDAITWWNETWRDFAQAMQVDKFDDAKELVGDRYGMLWDQPALLLHLSRIARADRKSSLAGHLLARVLYLCDRGLPKTDMTAFRYAAEAARVDLLIEAGDFDAAMKAYEALAPNQGNAVGHALQGAGLLALCGRDEEAMIAVAEIQLTAMRDRKGWSADLRRDFVESEPDLARLRKRPDWAGMVSDPADYLKSRAAR